MQKEEGEKKACPFGEIQVNKKKEENKIKQR